MGFPFGLVVDPGASETEFGTDYNRFFQWVLPIVSVSVHRKDPSVHKKLLGGTPLGRFVWSTRRDLSGPAISPGIQIDYMNILFLGESVSPLYVHKKCFHSNYKRLTFFAAA